jgi:hypothetical protein
MRTLIAAVFLPFLLGAAGAQEPLVPEWFQYNPDRPYAIFDAWRSLTTREAALYWTNEWTVIAGVLHDERGEPIRRCPLTICYYSSIRGYRATLCTDDNGHFIIYGPLALTCRDRSRLSDHMTREEYTAYWNSRGCEFSACPGYPYSKLGYRYARESRGSRACRPELVTQRDDRAFYVLTCDGTSTFDAEGFEQFKKATFAAPREEAWRGWREKPRPVEDAQEAREGHIYRVRVVTSDGKGIPGAVVKFVAYDGQGGNRQVVETDHDGQCSLEEYLWGGRGDNYYEEVIRELTIDAPGYGVGPVAYDLSADQMNTIVLERPAAVSGTVLDYNGNPLDYDLRVKYSNRNACAFEVWIPVLADGSFSFERIMPGQPFRIEGGVISLQATPRAPVRTDEFVLAPGERKADIQIAVPMAAAIYGIVVDHAGDLVPGISDLHLLDQDDGRYYECRDGRFAFQALGHGPYRLRVRAAGFKEYLTGPLELGPGELRFLKIPLEYVQADQ